MWKEAVVAVIRVSAEHLTGGIEFQTQHLTHTSLKHYQFEPACSVTINSESQSSFGAQFLTAKDNERN
jgi:hypothetical protein